MELIEQLKIEQLKIDIQDNLEKKAPNNKSDFSIVTQDFFLPECDEGKILVEKPAKLYNGNCAILGESGRGSKIINGKIEY